jgi:predicted nucleotidyltransferase
MLLERLRAACESSLPDATVIVHGSLALGDYRPGVSDVDLLVLSDATLDPFPIAVADAWKIEPGNFDLRVVRYSVAASPTRAPRMALYLGAHGGEFEIEREKDESDLVVEFSVCRRLGHTDLIGPVPHEWVDAVGATAVERWKEIGFDPPHQELMALTACRIWRFREERVHCSKPAAARWAVERGAQVAYDEPAVKALLERASS